jgi:hypothetical protein
MWGTWLDSAVCYAENIGISCSVANELNMDDASSITIIFRDGFNDSNEIKLLKTDLAYIHENFSFCRSL